MGGRVRSSGMERSVEVARKPQNHTHARQQYEKMRDFFTGKHGQFCVEAIERLQDIETLHHDGEPFRDRFPHATCPLVREGILVR